MVQVGDMSGLAGDDMGQVYDTLALADDTRVEDGGWHVMVGVMMVLNDIRIQDYVLE